MPDKPACRLKKHGGLESKETCEWKVMRQDLIVFVPSIMTVDVQKSCPIAEYGDLQISQCRNCAALHKPCEDQFTACAGCCGTKWHAADGTPYRVPSSHSCDSIKDYYKLKNSKPLLCGNETDPDLGAINATIENKTNVSMVFHKGGAEEKCLTDIMKVECPTAPTKLEFQCNPCNKGVPALLEQCCDECMRFAEGEEVQKLANEGIIAYVWCSGCHTDSIPSVETGIPFPFNHNGKYDKRTEAEADANMSVWVEENVCKQLEHTCATTSSTSTTSTTTTTTTTTTTISKELLFATSTDSSIGRNYWNCWRRADCPVVSGSESRNGKRNEYDNMPLRGLTFSCHEQSEVVWSADFQLADKYVGKSLLQIVQQCIGNSSSIDSNTENNGQSHWDAGRCLNVGQRTDFTCPGGCLRMEDELRIAVGDGNSDTYDWMLFQFQEGPGNSNSGYHTYGVGANGLASGACAAGGRIYIHGYHTTTTTTTTTSTTTTTTTTEGLCLDLCSLLNLHSQPNNESQDRRLNDGWSIADAELSGSCGAFSPVTDLLPFPEVECDFECVLVMLQNELESNKTENNSSGPSTPVASVPVASVKISGLGARWTEYASGLEMKSAVLTGFSNGLSVEPGDLQVEMTRQGSMVLAVARASETVALRCGMGVIPVEDYIKGFLKRFPDTENVKVESVATIALGSSTRAATVATTLPAAEIQPYEDGIYQEEQVDATLFPWCKVGLFAIAFIVPIVTPASAICFRNLAKRGNMVTPPVTPVVAETARRLEHQSNQQCTPDFHSSEQPVSVV